MTKTTYPTQRELETMHVPQLQALFGTLLGKSTRSPNRKFLIRSISGALASKQARAKGRRRGETQANAAPPMPPQNAPRADVTPPEAVVSPASGAGPGAPGAGAAPRGHYMGMSVPALQGIYLEKIGRPTGSHDRNYLVWKIREAEKGRVPVGARVQRDPSDEAKNIPVRMGTKALAELDAAWRATGYRSRTHFITSALGGLLERLGAIEAAEHFGQKRAG